MNSNWSTVYLTNILGIKGYQGTQKGGWLQIRLNSTDNYAQIQVSDTGIGISPEVLPYVFDRFRQGDSSTTRKQGDWDLIWRSRVI